MTITHNRMVDQVTQLRRAANGDVGRRISADVADADAGAAADRYGDPEELRRAIKVLPKGQRSASSF
jgi:DNA-directed RNA polymerase specialized sigma24 family protein